MLARAVPRSRLLAAPALRRNAVRALCTAPEPKLADEIKADIEMIKEKLAAKMDAGGYAQSAFEADLKAGKVDSSLLSSSLSDLPDTARKLALKLSMESSKMVAEMAAPPAIDWAAWESKISDPSVVAQVKAICDAEVAKIEAEASDEAVAAIEKEVLAAFNGSNGLLELASKEEKAAEAGMAQVLTDLEKLEVDVEGVANVTIAEILEREPELRAEIEEEIKNNVWAP